MNNVKFGDINSEFDLSKLAIGQKKEDLKYLNERQLSIFDAIDTNGDGKLSKSEIDNLKNTIKQYTDERGDDNFSLKDAKKVIKEMKKSMKEKGIELKANNNDLLLFLYQLFVQTGKNDKVLSIETETLIENKYGNRTIKEIYGNDGSKQEKTVLNDNGDYKAKYDANGKLTEKYYKDSEHGEILEKYNDGKLEKRTISKDGKIQTTEYEKDQVVTRTVEMNGCTIITDYNDGKVTTKRTFVNGVDLPKVVEVYKDDKLVDKYENNNKTTYQYDDHGKLVQSTVENLRGDKLVYDKDGQPLFFKLKDDEKLYPIPAQSLIDDFNAGKSIKSRLNQQ